MTSKDVGALRLRYRAAFEVCKVLVTKPDPLLSEQERRVLEALEDVRDALSAELCSNVADRR